MRRRANAAFSAKDEDRVTHLSGKVGTTQRVAHQIHAQHGVDAVKRHRRVRGVPLGTHPVTHEVRGLFSVEHGDQDPTPDRRLARQCRGDLHQNRDGGGVVVGTPEDLSAALAKVIVMGPQQDPTLGRGNRRSGRGDCRQQIHARAARHALLDDL